MVLARKSFEKFKDDLYVRGLILHTKPKLDISLGAMEDSVSEYNSEWEGVYNPNIHHARMFKEPMHLDEFVKRYDAAGKVLDIKEANEHLVRVSLTLCAVNPRDPEIGLDNTYLVGHGQDKVPIADGIPNLGLYVKTYFEKRFIDQEFCRPEQILKMLFPETYDAP